MFFYLVFPFEMSYIYWIDIENLFSWRSCASWFDIHRNGCASNKNQTAWLCWADIIKLGDVTPVSCASTHHALASLRNRLCLTHAPRGDLRIFFIPLRIRLSMSVSCLFLLQKCPVTVLSLNLKHLVSHHSKGLSKNTFPPSILFWVCHWNFFRVLRAV